MGISLFHNSPSIPRCLQTTLGNLAVFRPVPPVPPPMASMACMACLHAPHPPSTTNHSCTHPTVSHACTDLQNSTLTPSSCIDKHILDMAFPHSMHTPHCSVATPADQNQVHMLPKAQTVHLLLHRAVPEHAYCPLHHFSMHQQVWKTQNPPIHSRSQS